MTEILITGGTGTIGSRLTEQLARAGAKVRVGVRSSGKSEELKRLGVATVPLDFAKPATMTAACEGVNRIFLLSPFVEDFETGVRTVLAAARKAGIEHVVRSSAAGADPRAKFALAAQHGRCDQAVKESGMNWTILQPTFFQDNLVNFHAASIKDAGAFYGASGMGKTAYVSAADIAACAARVLLDSSPHRGKTYALTGPAAVSDQDAAAVLSEILGKSVSYVDLAPEALAQSMRSRGTPEWMVAAMVGLEGVKAAGWAAAVSPDVLQLLGRSGEDLAAFLKRHRAAFV